MATQRENPYGRFNFTVSWDGLDEHSVQAGFSEVSGLGMEIDVVEYRNGNEAVNSVRKLAGLAKYGNVTFKRGIIGSLELIHWIEAVRSGAQDVRRTVKIRLLSEDRQDVAVEWVLRNAWPSKYDVASLKAKNSGEIAIEELVLVHEGLEVQ